MLTRSSPSTGDMITVGAKLELPDTSMDGARGTPAMPETLLSPPPPDSVERLQAGAPTPMPTDSL